MKRIAALLLALVIFWPSIASASFGELEFVGFPEVVEVNGEEVTLHGWIKFVEKEHDLAKNIRIWVAKHEGYVDPSFIAGPLYDGDLFPITIRLRGTVGSATFYADDPRCPHGAWGIELVEADPTPTLTPTPDPPRPTKTPMPTPTITPTITPKPTETPLPTPIPTDTPTPGPTETPVVTPEPTVDPTNEPTVSPTVEPTDTPVPIPTEVPAIEDDPWVEGEEWFNDDELWGTAWVESWKIGITDAWLVIPLAQGVEFLDIEIELWSGAKVQWNEEEVSGIGRAIVIKGIRLGAKRDGNNWIKYKLRYSGELTSHKTRFLWKWDGECQGNEWEGVRNE